MAQRKHLSALPLLVAVVFACLPASALAAKETQTITFSTPPSNAKVEGPTYALTATSTSGEPVGLSGTPGRCTLSSTTSPATVSFIGAGTCTIHAVAEATTKYKKAEAEQTFAVAKGAQTIKFTSTEPSNAKVGQEYSVSAQGGNSGEAVTFTPASSSEKVCAVSASAPDTAKVSFIGIGTCVIDANQNGNANYEPAPQVQQSFSVAKGTQAIEFTSTEPSNATVAGPEYAVSAKGGLSGEPVVLTIDPTSSSVCELSGSSVRFKRAGPCKIDANQNGNANYGPAPQVQQSFSVSEAKQAVAFTSQPPEPTLVGFNYEVKATGGASKQPVIFSIDPSSTSICTISGAIVRFLAGGTCTIDAQQNGEPELFEAALPVQQQIPVQPDSQSVSFGSSPPSPAVVGGTYSVSASATSGLPVSFSSATSSVCTVSGSTVKLVGGGTCTINAEQGGDGQYSAAPLAQQSFAVTIIVTPGPPAPTIPIKPVLPANSNFKVVAASLSLATYSITFVEQVNDPGTFKWVLTFENGKFGEYAASVRAKKCKAGWMKIKGRCRPVHVLFGQGRTTVNTAGSVTFTVHPTKAGIAALRKAFAQNKGLPVTAHVTYQSNRGGSPVARIQSLIVKGRR
jgi:large repetitive protein